MPAMKSKLRILWFIQAVFILAIVQFAWLAEILRGRNSTWILWPWVMTAWALYSVFVGFYIRPRLIRRSEEALAKDASDPKALKQWQAAHLTGMASGEAVVLDGVVVRMVLGGALWQASLFYALGLILILLWTPRMPSIPISAL
jgi:hypothetical protein